MPFCRRDFHVATVDVEDKLPPAPWTFVLVDTGRKHHHRRWVVFRVHAGVKLLDVSDLSCRHRHSLRGARGIRTPGAPHRGPSAFKADAIGLSAIAPCSATCVFSCRSWLASCHTYPGAPWRCEHGSTRRRQPLGTSNRPKLRCYRLLGHGRVGCSAQLKRCSWGMRSSSAESRLEGHPGGFVVLEHAHALEDDSFNT
jgi:hypothetical protein